MDTPTTETRSKKPLMIGALVLIAVIALFIFLRGGLQTSHIPDLPVMDETADGTAIQVSEIIGSAFYRGGSMSELKSKDLPPRFEPDGKIMSPWSELKKDHKLKMKMVFHVPQRSTLRLKTPGNWLISSDGAAELIFDEAKTNHDRMAHTVTLGLNRGMVRAKSYEKAPGKFWLEIKTPKFSVVAENAEVGVRLSDKGEAQVWLVQGQAQVVSGFSKRDLKIGVVESL